MSVRNLTQGHVQFGKLKDQLCESRHRVAIGDLFCANVQKPTVISFDVSKTPVFEAYWRRTDFHT
jgi:hypothetical protein